jgi:hypothetical protein
VLKQGMARGLDVDPLLCAYWLPCGRKIRGSTERSDGGNDAGGPLDLLLEVRLDSGGSRLNFIELALECSRFGGSSLSTEEGNGNTFFLFFLFLRERRGLAGSRGRLLLLGKLCLSFFLGLPLGSQRGLGDRLPKTDRTWARRSEDRVPQQVEFDIPMVNRLEDGRRDFANHVGGGGRHGAGRGGTRFAANMLLQKAAEMSGCGDLCVFFVPEPSRKILSILPKQNGMF